jgi:hypothetical protein
LKTDIDKTSFLTDGKTFLFYLEKRILTFQKKATKESAGFSLAISQADFF